MIVDLVRNDLGRVCEFGSVDVPALCAVEPHPGLFHLVSTVQGRLRGRMRRGPTILDATFPPGSVTGAPKLAALEVIAKLEPAPAGPYCGAIGWVDADRQRGDLNVAIRTFWLDDGRIHFGTGGGITWDSTPEGEWEETELKARRLLVGGVVVVSTVWIERRAVGSDDGDGVAVRPRAARPATACSRRCGSTRGTPFAVRRHLERLARSAAGLGPPTCPDARLSAPPCEAIVAANGSQDGRLRITVTGGVAPLGSDRGGAHADRRSSPPPRSTPWPPTDRGRRRAVAAQRARRARRAQDDLLRRERRRARTYAHERGAGEALFGNTPATSARAPARNVFVVLDGELVTPPLSSGCLAGVTRALVLELTGAAEGDLPGDALDHATEVFLTSTTREVQPVGQPGPVTTRRRRRAARSHRARPRPVGDASTTRRATASPRCGRRPSTVTGPDSSNACRG